MKKNTLNMSQFSDGKLIVKPFMQDDIAPHDHNFLELAYVVEGSAVQNLNGEKESVSKGDYFIIDYGEMHGYQECRRFVLLNCLFLPEVIDESLESCRSLDELLRVSMVRYYRRMLGEYRMHRRIFHDDDGRVKELLCGLKREYEEKQLGWQEIARCRLKEILLLMTRGVLAQAEQRGRIDASANTLTARLLTYLEKNFTDRRVLSGFCEESHYSLSYISRHFRAETGLTVTQYLQRLRVDYSCEVLSGGASCAEAARAAGYDDVKFFETVFGRMIGMSPGAYRKLKIQPVSSQKGNIS